MATGRRRKISLLGLLSIVGGGAALGSMFYPLPWLGAAPYGLGILGLVSGIFALLNAYVLGHTGRVAPLLGLLLSTSAAGWAYLQGNRSDRMTQQFDAITSAYRGGSNSAPNSSPSASKSSAPAPGASSVSDGGSQRIGKGTIFDSAPGNLPDSNSIPKSSELPAALPPANSNNSPPPTFGTDLASQVASAQSAATTAKAKWNAAMANLMPALSKTAAYQSASAAVQSTEASLKAARASSEPGSPALNDAGNDWLQAKTALQKVIDNAATADSTASSARKEWLAAEAKLTALKSQLLAQTNAAKAKPKLAH